MLERKITSDKLRKHVATTKQKAPPQFQKLFLNNDISLPIKLQQFLSEGVRLSDSEKTNSNKQVRVVLKINECRDTPSCLTVNKSQNCVGVIDPTPSRRNQMSNTNVNLFPFDSILTDTDSPDFLFTDALVDPIMEFFKGRDSCLFSFGHSALGKTKSMVGRDQSISNIGIIPCALVWTFKLIDYLKRNNHHIRYFVRISAIEVSNKNSVSDLLADSNALSRNCGNSKTQGTYDQDKSNAILINQRELPASNLLEAACILDTALATRSIDNESLSHMQLIIHLYQSRVDAAAERNFESNINNVKCEKSRLIFLDLGSGRHGNEDQKNLSLQGISKVILALYTSQRHVPYKENVLTQLLKDTLSPNITTTMLLHISSKEQNYSETLQVVQLAYKLYRMRLKKYRSVGFSVSDETSSCSSSSSGLQSRRLRPHMGIGAARRSSGNSSASSDFEFTSASELSCCETVIFKGDSNNHNLSDKSPDRLSGKRKLRSVSSDSDNGFSDKDTSKSLAYLSGSSLSPTVLRRRRTSPRTNARAWPSTDEAVNSINECSPELWVDGPNAVYKVENIGIQYLDDRNNLNKTVEAGINLVSENNNKPQMISKETQCDDVWDSGSSITDGSSHSNTSDRKDHRPLSDISECTEETESNLAIESDFIKMNMIDQTEPTNVLDDLLESTFGLSPTHQGSQYKPLEQSFLDSQGLNEAHLHLIEKITKSNDISQVETPSQIATNSIENHSLVEAAIEKDKPICRNSSISRKHHSTSDSKRSSKSESKEKRSKSKCKKCSKKSENNRSKSMTSSTSTNFSRVTSWIENVEIETNSLFNKPRIINNQHNFIGYNNHNMHHHSQPDISYERDLFDANKSYFSPVQYQHQFSHNIPWINNNDSHQAQYSLYDGYNMTLTNSSSIPTSSLSRTNASYLPVPPATITQMSSLHPIVTQQDSFNTGQTINSPKSRRAYTHLSNISLPVNGVSVTQLPLPPLPQPTVYVDTHVPIIENLNTSCSYSTPSSTSILPIRIPPNPKCKTLPRDLYSDSATSLKRNKSDLHSSNAAETRFATSDSKIKDKSKKDSKNIILKLFAPFISLRKKINKNKIPPETVPPASDNDNINQLMKNLLDNESVQLICWPNIPDRIQPNLVLSSPYHLVTQPKTEILPTESSGNGSDSSFHNRELIKSKSNEASRRHKSRSGSMTCHTKNLPRQRPTSSGYGSINFKGDSEVSSHNDSSSEYSVSGLTSNKNTGAHSRIKHSLSLSNYKSIIDGNFNNLSKNGSTEISNPSCSVTRDINISENIKMAEDLIIQERLKMTLNEERKIVIQLVETNRLRGVPVDPSVMNLMCFKCLDNFDVDGPIKRNECEKLIDKLNLEIEQLKQTLIQAQNHLLLITSFDSHPQ